ncbi:hypothetical protein TNCT_186791 [Trichonephila clavata]|uniref:Uncharacterized protein n=1 Tax=Trichonephila clavata TaxID=2740835 RepID=A0A8X6LE45_TRICU|nr:hypothetical protein TNCT_186791 [Trichonephila clavata]
MSALLSTCQSEERRAIVTQSASVSKGTWADAGCVFTSQSHAHEGESEWAHTRDSPKSRSQFPFIYLSRRRHLHTKDIGAVGCLPQLTLQT